LSGDYEKTATKQQMTFLSLCTDAISLLFFAVFAVGGKIGWRYKASNFAGQLAAICQNLVRSGNLDIF